MELFTQSTDHPAGSRNSHKDSMFRADFQLLVDLFPAAGAISNPFPPALASPISWGAGTPECPLTTRRESFPGANLRRGPLSTDILAPRCGQSTPGTKSGSDKVGD